MSYSIAILGLLMEQPMHGYDLFHSIEGRGFSQFMRLSGGGLHHHLQKLEEHGDIEHHTKGKQHEYPEQQLYRITDQGQQTFLQQLRHTLADVEARRNYDPLDAALSFAHMLSPQEVSASLRYQRDYILPIIQRLQLLRSICKAKTHPSLPWLKLVIDHSLKRREAELMWLDEAMAEIDQFEKDRLLPPREFSASFWKWFDVSFRTSQQNFHHTLKEAWDLYQPFVNAANIPNPVLTHAKQQYIDAVNNAQKQYEQEIRHIAEQAKTQLQEETTGIFHQLPWKQSAGPEEMKPTVLAIKIPMAPRHNAAAHDSFPTQEIQEKL